MRERPEHEDDGRDNEPPNADTLAGEYVIGVLDAAQRREVEARIATDPGFARLVEAWQQRLAPWLDAFGQADVPAHLWPRIRRELGWSPVATAGTGWWQNVNTWRVATALAASLAMVAVLVGRPFESQVPDATAPSVAVTQPPPPPVAEAPPVLPVTTLAHEDGSPGWLASVDRDHGTVLMVPVPSPGDAEGRVAELWVIPEGGTPASLGVVSNDHSHTVEVPTTLRDALVVGATLAITLEPQGGAPGGVPTGPIIASGGIHQL